MQFRIFVAIFFATLLVVSPVSAAPVSGTLVKLACGSKPDVNDPCKAVYFSGSDGKRHAFPNEKVYFSWYVDFSSVQTVSSASLASLPLGQNVTYRPGSKLVKFLTDQRVYAVALGGTLRWVTTESAAIGLYGADWNKKVDDVNDAFFTNYRFGADLATVTDFSPSLELAAAVTVDDDLPATSRVMTVTTTAGSFVVNLIKLQKDRFRMITDAAETADCSDNCPSQPLLGYANDNGAMIGIHGTYACPPDYASCAGKTNTFLWPFFDTPSRTMLNAGSLQVHEGPMLTENLDGTYRYFHRTKEFGTSVTTLDAAVSHYPSLVENGTMIVEQESRLDEGMRTIKSSRGGIGMDDRFIYLVIARSATVVELARVFTTLNVTFALNLDGGGSSALLWNGSYLVGPGRNIVNALLFVPR